MSDLHESLRQLLALQSIDSEIDRLRYEREHLPAHSALAAVKLEAGVLRSSLDEVTARRDAAVRRQAELEGEVATIDKRIKQIEDRLFGSTPVGPKDAESMSVEVGHLKERRSALEDDELEVMEVLEPLEVELQQRQGEAQVLAERSRAAIAEVDSGQSAIDEKLAARAADRIAAAEPIPTELLAEYERLRPKAGGVAVAALVGGSCTGCHLSLSASEVEKVKAAKDSVSHCEECGRILVA